jgi:hypothetical protein
MHNFACCSSRVRKLVSDTKKRLRLRVSENRVLKTIFGTKKEEVEELWGRFYK